MLTVLVPDREAETAIEELMAEYGAYILRLCYVSLNDRELAEEAAQDCFVKAYRAWGSYRGASSEKTWLSAIAVNTCRDYRRKRWFKARKLQVSLEDVPEPSVPFDEKDDTLTRAVMKLPYRYRETIMLHYYQDVPVKDIAVILNLKPGSVYSRLRRGQQMLKPMLERWYRNED